MLPIPCPTLQPPRQELRPVGWERTGQAVKPGPDPSLSLLPPSLQPGGFLEVLCSCLRWS